MTIETLRDRLRDRMVKVLASSHPDGWPILPHPDRIDRLLQPRDAEILFALAKCTAGAGAADASGRILSLDLLPHDAFEDEHWRRGEPVRITYWRKPRIWRSTVGTWMYRGVLGVLKHIYRLRAPTGADDFDRKMYAALGVAALGLLAEMAREPVDGAARA